MKTTNSLGIEMTPSSGNLVSQRHLVDSAEHCWESKVNVRRLQGETSVLLFTHCINSGPRLGPGGDLEIWSRRRLRELGSAGVRTPKEGQPEPGAHPRGRPLPSPVCSRLHLLSLATSRARVRSSAASERAGSEAYTVLALPRHGVGTAFRFPRQQRPRERRLP